MQKQKQSFLTKEGKEKINNLCKIFMNNIAISWESFASIAGFILPQFVWIWILKLFLGAFVLWFVELTNYSLETITTLKMFFWMGYGIWLAINVLSRFTKVEVSK